MKNIILCAALLVPGIGHAEGFEDIAAIEARIRSEAGDSGTTPLIYRQLRLAKCPDQPTLESASTNIFVVRCAKLGWRFRVILNDQAIEQGRSAPLVQRGDAVDLIVTGNGFTISTAAVAVDAGVAGQSIRVKTLTGSPPVTAVVTGRGSVAIAR